MFCGGWPGFWTLKGAKAMPRKPGPMRWATLPMPMKPGSGRSFEVNSDDATAPIAGNCTTGLGCLPVFISTVPRSWLPSLVTSERTSDRCCIWSAMVGSTWKSRRRRPWS